MKSLRNLTIVAISSALICLVSAEVIPPPCDEVNWKFDLRTSWLQFNTIEIDNDDATLKTASGSFYAFSPTNNGGVKCIVKVTFGEDKLDQTITCEERLANDQFKVSYGTGSQILRQFMVSTSLPRGTCSSGGGGDGTNFKLDAARLHSVTVSQALGPRAEKFNSDPLGEPMGIVDDLLPTAG